MAMSRNSLLSVLSAIFVLQACQEEEVAGPTSFGATAVLKIQPSPLREGIDWNLEFATFGSDEVLAKAAMLAGTDPETLDKATRAEADFKSRTLRITARHQDDETAKAYSDALAAAYFEVRKEREEKLGQDHLEEMINKLNAQRKEFEHQRNELSNPIEDQEVVPLDEDRMTYEKALKALEENPISEDGVLYRKDEEK